MSSVAGECGRWFISHKVLVDGLRFNRSASSSCWLVGFVSSGSYSYPSRRRGSNLINAISLEEELGRAQSNPTHTKDIRSRLDTEQRPRSKVVLYFS